MEENTITPPVKRTPP